MTAKRTPAPRAAIGDNPLCAYPGCKGRLSVHPTGSKTCWCSTTCPCTGFVASPAEAKAVKKAAKAAAPSPPAPLPDRGPGPITDS